MRKIKAFIVVFTLVVFMVINNVNASEIWSQNFDGDDPLDLWSNIDKDGDGNVWMVLSTDLYTIIPHTSKAILTSESYINTQGPINANNYLVSPSIHIPNLADNYTLSFYVAGQDEEYFAEDYSLYIYTGDTELNVDNIEDDLLPAAAITETLTKSVSEGYTHKTLDLTPYKGQNIRLVFRHFGYNMFRINLDTISIYEGLPVYNVTTSATDGGSITLDETAFQSGQTVTFSVSAEINFKLVSITLNDASVEITKNESDYSFTMPSRDVKINVVFAEFTNNLTGGGIHTKGSSDNLTFTADAPSDRFLSLIVDEDVLLNNQYALTEDGETEITLLADFLNTLGVGTHVFTVEYPDAEFKQVDFSVAVKNPPTGDNTLKLVILSAAVMLSVVGIVCAAKKNKAK